MRTSILVLETERNFSLKLEQLFLNQYVIESTASFTDFEQLYTEKHHFLVLIEYAYLTQHASNLNQLIANQAHSWPVYVLLDEYDLFQVETSLAAGTSGFLIKNSSITSIGREIKAIERKLEPAILFSEQTTTALVNLPVYSSDQTSFLYGWSLYLINLLSQVNTVESLVRTTLSQLKEIELIAVLEICVDGQTVIYDASPCHVQSDYHNTIELFRGQGKVSQFGNRAVFYDQYAALFIRNMPVDEILLAAYSDVISKILAAIDSKLIAIINTQKLAKISYTLTQSMKTLKQVLHCSNREKQRSLEQLKLDMNFNFESCLLTEEQEKLLSQMLEIHLLKHDKLDESLLEQINQLQSTHSNRAELLPLQVADVQAKRIIAKQIEVY